MTSSAIRTLYICYFGVREPLVQTQVIPYLLEIAADDVEVHLLTFEPDLKTGWANREIESRRKAMADSGIIWHYLPYHKRPSVPATFYDIVNGARYVRRLLSVKKFDILHCRVHVPALMAVIARKFSRSDPKILFDIRGFFPEEYTDAGIWPENGWLYRSAKRVERWLLHSSDGFVVLTEKARKILFPESLETGLDARGRPVEVIPCCVDLARFPENITEKRSRLRRELAIGDRFVIAYVGSFGGWYLSDELFELFSTARKRDEKVFVLVLTQRDANTVREQLEKIGFGSDDLFVGSVPPAEIPDYLAAADAAVSFIKNCYSKQASSPTKNAEYLAAGLPIIANAGVGDVDTQINEDHVGVLIDRFSDQDYREALEHLADMGDIRERCRAAAEARFDLKAIGGTRYRRIYRRLRGRQAEPAD